MNNSFYISLSIIYNQKIYDHPIYIIHRKGYIKNIEIIKLLNKI